MSNTGRTQAERRAHTRQAVLDSACRLFGERGYSGTALEDIAADCGVTIRPVYHYFGNKKALFAAVNEVMEQRILQAMTDQHGADSMAENWRAYLDLCDDPGFRQIVLIDSPNVLGRERWADSVVKQEARARLGRQLANSAADGIRQNLLGAVVMGALTEAALVIADADDIELAKREAGELMEAVFANLNEHRSRSIEAAV